jgi:very-short-patch-repair endonuclease
MSFKPEKLKIYARHLRNNMTDAENILWLKLRRKQLHGFQFYRQKIIDQYIVDFYCHAANLVIELDGGQHFEEAHQLRDIQRDQLLKEKGLRVLRFTNREVLKHLDSVLEKIEIVLRNAQ